MNPRNLIPAAACLFIWSQVFAQAQDVDKELSTLADKLAAQVKDQGKKKVAVIDFNDLQGSTEGELGKYIAEQLTVNLVMGKHDFSVLDRANLKSILAEHKLTSQGLVDPENAKKLGQFAGVDALILGTIVPRGTNSISLTAKIITTDTAVIVGAARAGFNADETVQQLIAKPPTEPGQQGPGTPPAIPKPFGDLQARVESVKLLPGDNVYGFARMTLIITNQSASKTYGVAFEPDPYNKLNLSNSRGDEFRATDLSGITTSFDRGGAFYGSLTDVPPKSAIIITSKSQVRWNGKPGDYRPYRLQTTVIFGEEDNGRYPGIRKYNLILELK